MLNTWSEGSGAFIFRIVRTNSVWISVASIHDTKENILKYVTKHSIILFIANITNQYFMMQFDEELLCGLCLNSLEDPVNLPICAHTYCKCCLEQWQLTGAQCCPQCRAKCK